MTNSIDFLLNHSSCHRAYNVMPYESSYKWFIYSISNYTIISIAQTEGYIFTHEILYATKYKSTYITIIIDKKMLPHHSTKKNFTMLKSQLKNHNE